MAPGSQSPHRQSDLGCLLISSPQGHSGKTTVTAGLCNVLRRMGFSVQPFKKGPDYIDPSWLTKASGRICRNLDPFLMSKERWIESFHLNCKGVDFAILEGAMGLYDGLDSHGTTAEIARVLSIPILFLVNTARMTSSIAPMVTGYQHFQAGIHIAGIILNHVSGSRHEMKLKDAVERYCGIPVVGSIPRDQDLHIAERHLGLIPSTEFGETETLVERIGQKLEAYLDLEAIVKIAQTFYTFYPEENGKSDHPYPSQRLKGISDSKTVRIGILRDQAFNFYYPENFEALTGEGAELVFINSLAERLPPIDGLYIGGGFPEFFLDQLEANRGLREDIVWMIEKGLPVYAECAGLIYLCRTISWRNQTYEMVGVIPADVFISEKPQGHGYVIAEVTDENPFLPQGVIVRGHEFHHSEISGVKGLNFAYRMKRGQGIDGRRDGIVYKNLFASYIHLHALGTPEWAKGFVEVARKQKAMQVGFSA